MNIWNGIDKGVKVQYNFTRGYSYSQVYNFDDKKHFHTELKMTAIMSALINKGFVMSTVLHYINFHWLDAVEIRPTLY